MTCGCKEKPCNCNNCPDDGEITILTPLDADECCTGWCGSCGTCKDNCWVNIQSTNDCLTVDTSECGVVKLTSHCPPIVTAWDNITVDKNYDCWDWCSVEYIVSSDCKDEKVKVEWCGNPGYLADLITAWDGIQIDTSCNELVIKNTAIPEKCPDKNLRVVNTSTTIATTYSNSDTEHVLVIEDAENPFHYAKIILTQDWIKEQTVGSTTKPDEWVWQYDVTDATWATWKIYRDRNTKSMAKWVDVTDAAKWILRANKHWLYHVGFSWTFEIGSFVHAFRVQLYQKWKDSDIRNTLVESRFSAPIWDQPFEMWIKPAIHYVSWVSASWGWESPVSVSASYKDYEFKLDAPLRWPATDIEWTPREQKWYSASLWAYVSRFPVWWSTIVELDKWDEIFIWCKVSSQIRYTWDLMWKIVNEIDKWEKARFALLQQLSSRSWKDQWPECWLSFYIDLIHPLN